MTACLFNLLLESERVALLELIFLAVILNKASSEDRDRVPAIVYVGLVEVVSFCLYHLAGSEFV